MGMIKADRMMDIFFRALKGEAISVQKLAEEYGSSPRSISRDISSLNMFLADHRDSMGNTELVYDAKIKSYLLTMDEFISGRELLALIKVLIACRAFNTEEILSLLSKLKKNATPSDRRKIEYLISKEMLHYVPVKNDCVSILDNVWEISEYIEDHRLITITYNKMDRSQVKRKIMPLSLMYSEYYYYLIARECDDDELSVPKYFRVDRIIHITAHRECFSLKSAGEYDEGLLRKRSHFMWPGSLRRIRFEFYGPSVQAVLDKIPTAKIIEKLQGGYLIEAEVYGDGIKMFLLSQGSWVKVIGPEEFVSAMKEEISKMAEWYKT